MLLVRFVSEQYLLARIGVTEEYKTNLSGTISRFSESLGHEAELSDLTISKISRYLTAYSKNWKPRSTNNQRQILLMFWRAAHSRKFTKRRPPDPKLIRVIPEEFDPPEAWNDDQVNRLMEQAADQSGEICGVPAGLWWLSLTLVIYETSCRISATLSVPPNHYDGIGIMVRKQKNHRPQWYRLSSEACQMIKQVMEYNQGYGKRKRKQQRIWNYAWYPKTVWKKFRQIVESAELPAPKTGRQLFHRLRRTTITFCAAADPAIAQRTAGHADYATTLKHYIDPRLIGGRCAVDVLPDPLRLLRAKRENQKRQPAPLLYCSEKPNLRIYG